jgi:putative hemolysin
LDPEPSYLHEQVIDVNLIIYILGIIFFLFLSALISGAKVSFFTISSKEIENSNQQNNLRNSIIAKLLEAPKKLSATLLLCHIILNIGIILLFSLISDIVFHDQTSPLLLFVQIVIIVFVLLFFVEILPKRLARKNHILYAQKVAPIIKIITFVLTPISLPMRNILNNFQDKFGFEKNNFSVSQLSRALEMTSDDDTTQEEQKILEGIVSFGSTDTSQVMTPRIDVFALEITETL